MKFVKFILELRLEKRLQLLKPYEEIHKVFLGEEPKDVEKWLTPSMRLENKNKKIISVIEKSRCAVEIQEPPNNGYCLQNTMRVLDAIDEFLHIPTVKRIGLRSIWIESFKGEFNDLVHIYKDKIYSKNTLIEKSSDVCVILDFQEEEGMVHLISGPMQEEQLRKQYFPFVSEKLPEVFVFCDIDYSETLSREYNKKFINGFVNKGIKYGEEYSKEYLHLFGDKI